MSRGHLQRLWHIYGTLQCIWLFGGLRLSCDAEASQIASVMMDVSFESLGTRSRVVYAEHDFALGACRDMFFVLWLDRTTVDGIATLEEQFYRFSQDRGKELALVTIVSKFAAKGPSADARHKLATWLGQASNKLVISAVVFEGDGFLAALVRGIATGLAIVAQPNCPHRVVATLQQAGEWFQKNTAHGPRVFKTDYVVARVTEFRNAVSPQASSGTLATAPRVALDSGEIDLKKRRA
jgi:hypothetical protein